MKKELYNNVEVDEITELIIGAAFKVHNKLGFGFLESVYEKSLMIELVKLNLNARSQNPIKVFYDEQIVGDFCADITIEDQLIVELKSVTTLHVTHEVQLVNYLNATGIRNGLLINFGPEKVSIKRKHKNIK